jgi:hypothetical protein
MEEKKPLRNFGLITPSEYIGKSYVDARKYAEDGGFTTRIVEENGVSHMLEMDAKSNRLNFRIINNIITDVYGG